jgi:hypothetical protein
MRPLESIKNTHGSVWSRHSRTSGLSYRVAKRTDIFATALFHRMAVKGIRDLDLSYTPPFSAPWDPVHVAADAWVVAAAPAARTVSSPSARR